MREIKFRAWNPHQNVMLDWNRLSLLPACQFLTDNGYNTMQYTGLQDKNGREIYEGDIVQHEDFSIGCTVDLNITGVVKMVEGSWCVERGDNGEYLFTETGTNEVIGSIYENPELLEV